MDFPLLAQRREVGDVRKLDERLFRRLGGRVPGYGRGRVIGGSLGAVVYLGIMAADVIREHSDRYPKHERQKIPSGPHVHHVMLALFDVSSGERITDADVEARVSPLGLSGPKKRLDPTSVAGAVTYCNYFTLAPTETYVIQALIRRPGVPHVNRAKFVL